jgi:hypothetical protein
MDRSTYNVLFFTIMNFVRVTSEEDNMPIHYKVIPSLCSDTKADGQRPAYFPSSSGIIVLKSTDTASTSH